SSPDIPYPPKRAASAACETCGMHHCPQNVHYVQNHHYQGRRARSGVTPVSCGGSTECDPRHRIGGGPRTVFEKPTRQPMDPRIVLDNLDAGVVAIGPDWTVAEWSAPAARMTGLPA